jgi:hypothetical protein
MDYAQARMQARHGERPGEALWLKLRSARGNAALLELARACGLRRWVAGLVPESPSHEIESKLKSRLREAIAEVAAWVPAPWRAAVLHTQALVDLPAALYLARGEPPRLWMQGVNATAEASAAEALAGWEARWRALWPQEDAAAFTGVEALLRLAQAHLRSQARLDPALAVLFRRYAGEPAAAFAFLLLAALEIGRLRAALLRQALLVPARLAA